MGAELELKTELDEMEPDYTQRVGQSFMIGLYLGVNAVRDLYLLVEGPDCVHIKSQYVQGNHDWLSTLTSVSGFHRIANTALHPDRMSGSREAELLATLKRIAGHDAVPALALTSMPMAYITGADYDRLTAEAAEATRKAVFTVPGKSLGHDWLDGYAEVLKALAQNLELGSGELDPRRIAIVGYLFDRNEGDHTANIAELTRMVSALDHELVSVWLSGSSYADLAAASTAGTIVSLPYGRRAARVLARRTGARLVELPLPIGLPHTESWLRELGAHLGAAERAEAFIDHELARVVPKLEWVIPFLFQNRELGYVGDPHILPGLASFWRLLGARLRFAVITNRPMHCRELSRDLAPAELLVYPKNKTLAHFMGEQHGGNPVDLIVASDLGHLKNPTAAFELGFPSPNRHALFDRPFLGFRGALALADGFANAILGHALAQAAGQDLPPRP